MISYVIVSNDVGVSLYKTYFIFNLWNVTPALFVVLFLSHTHIYRMFDAAANQQNITRGKIPVKLAIFNTLNTN